MFRAEGFIVCPGFFEPQEAAAMKEHVRQFQAEGLLHDQAVTPDGQNYQACRTCRHPPPSPASCLPSPHADCVQSSTAAESVTRGVHPCARCTTSPSSRSSSGRCLGDVVP